MNIALIIERIEIWRGGAERSTMAFANHLARRGCRVQVLTTSQIPSTPSLTIVPIKARGTFRSWRTWRFAQGAARYVRENDFDVVHSITPCPEADVYQPRGGTVPEMLARNVALRSSLWQRQAKRLSQRLNVKYRVIADLERRLLTRKPPPWVIAISQYVVDQLHRHYRFDRSRIRLIFNGVDPDTTPEAERIAHRREIRRQLELGIDDLLVLCVAHNFKLKGVSKLIEALARCPSRDGARTSPTRGRTVAVIVGRDNPAPFGRLAERLGVADRVLFSGPTQRIGAFFHAADMLVHPTFYDPCSRVVLEALAAGLPVITTRFNGAAERITDGGQGYVIDSPMDVDALADRIDRLSDGVHRRACALQAAQAVQDVTLSQHADEVFALYQQVVAEGGAKRRRQG